MIGSLTHMMSAFIISGDGMTHKSLTYKSRSIMMPVPMYSSEDDTVRYQSWFFGINYTINYTLVEQLLGWKHKFNEAHLRWLQSPMGSCSLITILESVTQIWGMFTNHATDQKKC
jgi:hypothetical protein